MVTSLQGRLLGVTLATLSWLGTPASGQTLPGSTPRAEAIAANSRASVAGSADIRNLASATGPRAIPRVDGTAAPGLKVTLDGSGSSGGRVWYRWIQTQGPPVSIQKADQVEATVVVPDEATTLGFVLVVGNSAGVDARAVTVEVEDLSRMQEDAELKADAGPNQTVSVGRRVSLDGKASEPRGRIRYRWIQASGPKASIQSTAGTVCSFVPEIAGDYSFALMVVGATGLVSEAALVTVHAIGPNSTSGGERVLDPSMPLDEFARQAVESIPGGSSRAPELAVALETVADRIESFKTYLEAATELTQRLDASIPHEPKRRDEWINSFFKPWTVRVADAMKPTKIDLTQPANQTKPLTKAQRSRLADQFRLTAAGLRSIHRLR